MADSIEVRLVSAGDVMRNDEWWRWFKFELPADDGEHPFKHLRKGQRMAIAIALINDDEKQVPVAEKAEKPKQRWQDTDKVTQAGIRCGDVQFQEYLSQEYPDYWETGRLSEKPTNKEFADLAAIGVRAICQVESRAELNVFPCSEKWEELDAEYRKWAGMETEER